MKQIRKRRIVEIYFVLYLAALILILPDTGNKDKSGKGTGIQIFQPEFVILPEKTTLTCRVLLDSLGPKILSIDSVNTIFYTGDVEDVRFEFFIQDQSLRNTLTLSSDKKPFSKHFRLEQNERQAALFYWTPPMSETYSKTYLVRVVGTAKTKKPDASITTPVNDNEGGKVVKYSAQFSLLVIYVNAPGGNPLFAQVMSRLNKIDTSFQMTQPFQSLIPQIQTGKLSMFVKYNDIKQVAYQRWINSIYVSNANPIKDLSAKEVSVKLDPPNNDGKAEIFDVKDDEIIMHGITPSSGRMKVEVKIRRKSDGSEASETFNVVPQPLEQPEYERFMYPEIAYYIDPKLPLIGREIRAQITDGNNVRAQSVKGEKFRFMPNESDVDKIFYLERFLDNQLFGERLPIRVLNYSEPLIVDIMQRSKNEVEVITKSYGFQSKYRNEVDNFIVDGNARYQDQRGKINEQDKTFPVVTQYFKFYPDNPDKPFHFKIIAVDKRGRKSMPKVFRGE